MKAKQRILSRKVSNELSDSVIGLEESASDLEELDFLANFDQDEATHQSYTRHSPLIFIGGVPRSGTTLMRAMLDAHPSVRCGEETRIVPRILHMRHMWKMAPKESERLESAGITDTIVDAAIGSFVLEVMVRHGKKAQHLCNKDPLVLRYAKYVNNLFPQSKFVLMLRDGRATVHSIITRKVTISGFDLSNWEDCMRKWNMIIENMYTQCVELGSDICLPVHYEQLVLHPESSMRRILSFLNVTWNDAVLHHEKFIGDKISLSKVERSSDQVIKPVNLEALTSWVGSIPEDLLDRMDEIAPMLRKLGYDPEANPPKYGDADEKIKANSQDVENNSEYWKQIGKKYSVHV